MFHFLTAILHSIFKIIFSNQKDLIFTLMLLKKENEIYKRQINLQKVQSTLKRRDRLLFSLISKLSRKAINHLTIVKPSTLLDGNADLSRIFGPISIKHLEESLYPKKLKI